MESLHKSFNTNYENNIAYYKGDQGSITKFFVEHLEQKFRNELDIDEKTTIDITKQNDHALSCLVSYPYNINLTILFHKTDICTCGQQYRADVAIGDQKIKNIITSLVRDYSL
jgi:hypothetical protein